MRFRLVPVAVALVATVSACGSSPSAAPSGPPSILSTSSSPPAPSSTAPVAPTIESLSAALRSAVPQISKTLTITEDNDPNNLIGRPNGYKAAEVLYDKRVSCTDVGADCGAMIEQWPTAEAAKARMDYIQGILKNSPMLGSEYDYPVGDLLVRVAGDLKPSEAAVFRSAVGG